MFIKAFFCLLGTMCLYISNAQDSAWTIRQISPNVYFFETKGTLNDIVQGNCIVIEGEKELIVVDSFNDMYLIEKALKRIAERSRKPIRYLINTHWHYDHVMGNYLVKKQFPNCVLVTHSFTEAQLKVRVPNYVKNISASLNAARKEYEKGIETGMLSNTIPLTKYEREKRFPLSVKQFDAHIQHITADYRHTLVDIAFTDSLRLKLDSQEVIVFHPGHANTKGDIMVYLPHQKILVTGDVVVHPIPYAFGSNHDSWIKVLEKIRDMDVSVYIPGHGEALRNKDYIQTLIEVFTKLNTEVSEALIENLTLDQTKRKIQLTEWEQKMAGEDEEKKWAFRNYFLDPAIQSVYNDYKAKKQQR